MGNSGENVTEEPQGRGWDDKQGFRGHAWMTVVGSVVHWPSSFESFALGVWRPGYAWIFSMMLAQVLTERQVTQKPLFDLAPRQHPDADMNPAPPHIGCDCYY